MRPSTIPLALAVLFTVAACGRNEGASGSPAPAPAPAAASTPAPPPPPAPAPAASGPEPSASASATGGASSSAAASGPGGTQTASAGGNGATVYSQTCVACHGAGVAGAPKLGDKADWGPRIAQGKDTLYAHALQGYQGQKGVMPPKGGNTALSDADVRAAVDHMVSQAQ